MRLELSSEGRYAIRALVYLARVGEQVNADTISEEADIPRRLLARILARLSHAGLVESHAGRGGGSRLARPASEITLRDAVEAVEGPFDVTKCIMEERACGVWVVDINSGQTVAFLRFEDAVQEVFAVQVLPGLRYPELATENPELLVDSYDLPSSALEDVPPELLRNSGPAPNQPAVADAGGT